MEEWKYYNHALVPALPPHMKPDTGHIRDGSAWRPGRAYPLFARWTSDFDCGYETGWWYCIKDDVFNIEAVKSNYRFKIRKSLKRTSVRQINQADHTERLYEILDRCVSEYSVKYRPRIDREKAVSSIKASAGDPGIVYIGCFEKTEDLLVGYAVCSINLDMLELTEVKVLSEYQNTNAHAALVYYICLEFLNKKAVRYISSGERNIRHETNYQEYLIKYFGFRRAYCTLNIEYAPAMKAAVALLFPFMLMLKNTNSRLLYNIYCLLRQEEIRKSFARLPGERQSI